MSGIINKVKDALHSDKDKTHEAPQGSHGTHSSKVANTADPRIDSDRDHRANPGTGVGHTGTHTGGVGSTGTHTGGIGSTGTHTGTHTGGIGSTGTHTGAHSSGLGSTGGVGSTGAYDTAEG